MAGLAVLALAVGLAWCFSVPFHGGPDEAAHFHIARFIASTGRLPLFSPTEMWLYHTEVGAVESYASFPPLAYILGSLAMPIFGGAFWGGRLISLLAYAATGLVTYAIVRRIIPRDRGLAGASALVMVLLPQASFVGAYFNNDALATLEATIGLYLLLLHFERPRLRTATLLGIVVGSLLITKYTFYALGVVLLVAAIVACRGHRARAHHGLCALGACGLVSGWWFFRNLSLYGELVPSKIIAAAKEAAGGNSLYVAADHGVNLLTLSFVTDFWLQTLQSFVGVFGFQEINLHPAVYIGCLIMGLLSLMGVVRYLRSARLSARALTVVIVAGASIAATGASAMGISTYGEWSAQGRYLFPVLPLVAMGVVFGWWKLVRYQDRRGLLRWTPVAVLAVVNAWSLVGTVIPGYFGATSRHILLQLDSNPSRVALDDELTLTGWTALEAAPPWRPFSPAIIETYRRSVEEVVVYTDGPPGTGRRVGKANASLPRRDVGAYYGNNQALVYVGYEVRVPLGRVPPGNHDLYVCAFADSTAQRCLLRSIEVG